MMDRKYAGPAFPVVFEHSDCTSEQHGMDLIDYFAAKALPPCMYLCVNDTLKDGETRAELYARKAYEVASAMLGARAAAALADEPKEGQ